MEISWEATLDPRVEVGGVLTFYLPLLLLLLLFSDHSPLLSQSFLCRQVQMRRCRGHKCSHGLEVKLQK